jgi:hypothetical protein
MKCMVHAVSQSQTKQVQWPQSASFRRKLLQFQKLAGYRETLDNLWIQNSSDVTLSHSMWGSDKQSKKNLTWTWMFRDHSECQQLITQWHISKYKQTWIVSNSAVRNSNFAFSIKPTEQDGSGSNISPLYSGSNISPLFFFFYHCTVHFEDSSIITHQQMHQYYWLFKIGFNPWH